MGMGEAPMRKPLEIPTVDPYAPMGACQFCEKPIPDDSNVCLPCCVNPGRRLNPPTIEED